MNISQLLMIISICTLAACGSSKKSTETTEQTSTEEAVTEMYLSKGICYGKCPRFELEIMQNGKAVLKAKQNVPDKFGVYQKQLSDNTYQELKEAFAASSFDKFDKAYESQIPDLPLIKVGYLVADSLHVSEGKEGRPSELMQLQYRLENIVQTDGWELIEKYDRPAVERESERPKYITNEIIILPKPGTNLPRLFRTYSDQGFRVLKRIAPNQNYWLTTYDEAKINAQDFLKLLKTDERIVEAEFNVITSNRGGR